MNKRERYLLWSSVSANMTMGISIAVVWAFPIPNEVFDQYQPLGISVVVGCITILLILVSVALLVLALCSDRV